MPFATPMINIYSADIEAALRFYRELIGLTETFRTPREGTPDHVELQVDGVTIAVSSVEAAQRVHGIDATPGSPSFQLVLWTDDVDASYDALVAAGAPAVTPPHDSGNNNRNAVVRDPDGNLVEMVMKRS